MLTDALLGLPWVADGVERMLETLLIGGAAGTAVAAEFVIPLLVLCAGAALLGLLVLRVGLEVVTALVYVLGGLALGASVTGLGRCGPGQATPGPRYSSVIARTAPSARLGWPRRRRPSR